MFHSQIENAEYLRYKEFKKRFDIKYKNYPLQKVFSHEILRICFHKKWPKAKSLFRWFVIPHPSFIKPFVKNEVILFSDLYYERKDYKNFLAIIIKQIKSRHAVYNYDYGRKIKFVFNYKNIASSVSEVFKRKSDLRITEMIYYAASLTYIKNYLNMLEKNVLPVAKIKALVAFNSSVTPDSIVTCFFKSNNIPTYSLQHGAYVEYMRKIPMDISNYENVTADKMLCWGENTAKLLEKYGFDKSNIIISGNPKYRNISIGKIKQTFKKGLVLLPRWSYHFENIQLLELLGEYKKKNKSDFHIKLHPSLDTGKYQQLIAQNDLELIDKEALLVELFKSGQYDFAISFNSTAYYEPMFYGIPSLRYAKYENENYTGLDDKFRTAHELNEQINKFKQKKHDELKTEIKNILKYVFGYDTINYSNVIDSCEKN